MKKLYLYSILIFTLCRISYGQSIISLNQHLNNHPNSIYTAREKIILQPGFRFNGQDLADPALGVPPEENIFQAKIDENILYNSDYNAEINLDNYVVDKNLAYGYLPSEYSVNNGFVNYNIPINLPSSTNNIKPELSLTYVSNYEGLLGVGWNIKGLYVISRVGKNNYLNNDVSSVNINSQDQFALDGNILLAESGQYGNDNTVYSLFNNSDFVKIISHGNVNNNGPESFTLETKDGKIIEFGTTADSRVSAHNNSGVIMWAVSKIVDKATGNYIKYNYTNVIDGYNRVNFRIKEILYACNDNGLQPSSRVQFVYDIKQYPKNHITLINQSTIDHNTILKEIRITNESHNFFKYKFEYTVDEFNVKLQKIKPFGINEKEFNPTIIEWGVSDNINGTFMPNAIASNSLEKTITGDFNGDGFTDIISFPKKEIGDYTSLDKWSLKINNKNSTFTQVATGDLSNIFYDIKSYPYVYGDKIKNYRNGYLVIDINSDGLDDMLYVEKYDNTRLRYIPYISNGVGFTPNLGLSFIRDINRDEVIADIDGDGYIEFVDYRHNHDIYNPQNNWSVRTLNTGQTYTGSFPITHDIGRSIFSVDIDGDSKGEIVLYNTSYLPSDIKILEWDNNAHDFIQTYYANNSLLSNNPIYPSDFNGDGRTDFLIFDLDYQSTSGKWKIATSTGNSFDVEFVNVLGYNNPVINNTNDNIFIADFNGDGRSDILQITTPNSGFDIYYSSKYARGTTFVKKHYNHSFGLNDDQGYDFGDFNADGSVDILYKNLTSPSPYMMFLTQNDSYSKLVKKIIDGRGNYIKVDYVPLTNSNTTSRTIGLTLPNKVHHFNRPIYVVNQIRSLNNKNFETIIEYKYFDPLINSYTKNFLGFSKIETHNISSGIFSSAENQYNPEMDQMLLNKTISGIKSGSTVSPISQIMFEYNIQRSNINQSKAIKISKKSTNDYLLNLNTVVDFSYDQYGNLISESLTTNTNDEQLTTFQYEIINSFAPNRITNKTVTRKYSGKPPYIQTFQYSYYPSGQQKEEIMNYGQPKYLRKVNYYSVRGNIIKIEKHTPTETVRFEEFLYDSKGIYLLKKTNSIGHEVEYEYDVRSNNLISTKNSRGNIETYKYDEIGNLVETIDYNGLVMKSNFEWADQDAPVFALYQKKEQMQNGELKKTYYDNFDNELLTISKTYNNQNLFVESAYNIKGEQIHTTEPFTNSIDKKSYSITYDIYGRKLTLTGPNVSKEYSYNGLSITENDIINNRTNTKNYDYWGNVISSVNYSGTVVFNYSSNGKATEIITDGKTVNISYDSYGHQTSLLESGAPIIEYAYNAFGEITYQKGRDQKITTYAYDALGRMIEQINDGNAVQFEYDLNNNKGVLSKIIKNDYVIEYVYDSKGNVINQLEYSATNSDINFSTTNYYNNNGKIIRKTFPSGYSIAYNYNSRGELIEILDYQTNNIIWKLLNKTKDAEIDKFQYGNGLIADLTFNQNGNITQIKYDNLLELEYTYNLSNNIIQRKDKLKNLTEDFVYDNKNRLVSSYVVGKTPQTIQYANNQIVQKSDVGNYTYDFDRITTINNVTSVIPTQQQDISYNDDQKPISISEGDYELNIEYNPISERIKSNLLFNGQLIEEIYYSSDYEKIIRNGVVSELNYIYSPVGLVAIVNSGSNNEINYIHNDIFKSIVLVTNQSKIVVEARSYDAWGRLRNANTWDYSNVNSLGITKRGFTGQEHLEQFNLINLNNRLYDPILGIMLGPDNYNDNEFNSQNYNRYAYALNNPLSYTDPNGDHPLVLVAVAALFNALHFAEMARLNGQNPWVGFAVGAVIGVATSYVGNAISTLASSTGFISGAIIGSISGGITTLFTQVALNEITGIGDVSSSQIVGGMISGAIFGGISGAMKAKDMGRNIVTGKVKRSVLKMLEVNLNINSNEAVSTDRLYDVIYNSDLNDMLNDAECPDIMYPGDKPSNEYMKDKTSLNYDDRQGVFNTSSGKATAVTLMKGKPQMINSKPHYRSDIYIGKSAFTSLEKLYTTIGHELMHAYQNYYLMYDWFIQYNYNTDLVNEIAELHAYQFNLAFNTEPLLGAYRNIYNMKYENYIRLLR